MVVELRYAPLPYIGAVAVHYWFVVLQDGGERRRWEVWQRPDAGGRSIGHVHCDLKGPDEGVGGGPMRVAARWQGDEAARIQRVLDGIGSYPWCRRYRMWPGPNSNTFAAWVLAQAGIAHSLGWRAFGAGFRTA